MCLKCLGSCLLSSAIVAYVVYLSQPGSSLYSYHPACMTLAFIGLVTVTITSMCRRPLLQLARPTKVLLHSLVGGGAGLAAAGGFYAIYTNKDVNNKPHFVSWHGLVGLVASALLLCQVSFGALVKYPSITRSLVSYSRLRFCHLVSGLLVYITGDVAFKLGLFNTWFQKDDARLAAIALFGAQLLLTWGVLSKWISGSNSNKQKTRRK